MEKELNQHNKAESPPIYTTEFDTHLSTLLQKVPSTAAILLYKLENKNINSEWIDWAVKMLVAGYDYENLAVLAGEDIHCNPFEFAALRDKIFDELNLNDINNTHIYKIYKIYGTYIVQQAIEAPNKVYSALWELDKLYIDSDCDSFFINFYLLSNAVTELEELGIQSYWEDPNLTKENMENYVLNYFKQWIKNPLADDNYIVYKSPKSKNKNILSKLLHFFK